MTSWVQEKLGNVLEALGGIADIAKDPETPAWYKRNLRQHLHRAFGDGLKVLLWSHDRTEDWNLEAIRQPTEHGTLGLAALLNEMKVPHHLSTGVPSFDPEDDDDREPPNPPEAPQKSADPWADPIRQAVMRHVTSRLADRGRGLAESEARLLGWIAYHVTTSEYADIGLLTPEFLGSDVGLSKEDGAAALQGLIDKKIVEKVPELEGIELRRLALRIVVEGLNDRQHAPSVH